MSEFKIGDRVRMTSTIAHGSLGRIVEIDESAERPYQVALLDENGNDDDAPLIFHMVGDQFEPEDAIYKNEDIVNMEIGDYLSESTDGPRPRYRVGDVVLTSDDPEGLLYVISESVLVDTGESMEYMYELISAYNGGGFPNIQSKESAIDYRYHDKHWENIITEGTTIGNGLVKWKGKPYNFYIFYGDASTHGDLDKNLMEEYNDHTIPPKFMEHILDSHSLWDRMDSVLGDSINRAKLMSMFKLDKGGLKDMREHIRKKITANNMNNLHLEQHGKVLYKQKQLSFTDEEESFIDEVFKLDTEKDHYPTYMTYLQIMMAIKEAYDNAEKTNDQTVIQPSLDKRTGESRIPVKGQRIYRGKSETYNLLIEFWYDYDLNVITTAYPINAHKKH